MAVATIPAAADSTGHESGLSDYEKLRLKKIKRNEDRMKELGLFRTKNALAASVKKKSSKKTKNVKQNCPDGPPRRSSRNRRTVSNYSDEQVIPMYEDDEEKARNENSDSFDESESNDDVEAEDDYESSDNNDDDDEDEEMIKEPPKKRPKPSKPEKDLSSNTMTDSKSRSKKTAVDTTFDCINPKGGLVLEYAKTGRSSCRKCRNKIDKGRPRIGMEAWIVGRNCITWQLPECMLQNLCCLYEKSNGGKGKCKASHTTFAKGQLKIGIRCHTATYYYRVKSIGAVLANVVALMRSEKGHETFKLKVDDIDGSSKLSQEDRQTLVSILEKSFQISDPQGGTPIPAETKSSTQEMADAKEKRKTKTENTTKQSSGREQPKLGAKTGAKGRVEWKFGGRSCYGHLIPRMETKTHCYARTHKGNVKTLAKGKDYWTMLD